MQIGSGDVFVRRTGDTMTGNLVLSAISPKIILNDTSGAGAPGIQYQSVGAAKMEIYFETAQDTFTMYDSAAALNRFRLARTTGVISIATAPLAVIGDSGTVTVNGIGPGASATTTITPAGYTGKTVVTACVRNSVSTLNNEGMINTGINQTDVRSTSLAINSDATFTFNNAAVGAGNVILNAKNTNVGVANLTFDWAAFGR